MIKNVLSIIPKNWVVQIFHLNNDQFENGMNLNKGLRYLIDNNDRVLMTAIPEAVAKVRTRPKHVMLHPWIWESMVADTVLLFGGNHVFCGNSPFKVTASEHF